MKTNTPEEKTKNVIAELVFLIKKGNAHAGFKDAVKDLTEDVIGQKPYNLPYSIWQLVEHIRMAQWDLLGFSSDPKHVSPDWPEGFWPKEAAPENMAAFKKSIEQIEKDQQAFIALLEDKDADIYKPFAHGDGQTLLREALVLADHTSYHTGEIIMLRRLLGAWKK